MLPIRDDIPSRRFPVLTVTLIVLNVLAFFWEISLGRRLEDALMLWGLVPVRYTDGRVAAFFSWPEQAGAFFTSMFLHGGWTHLIGNMWTLWIFGDNVEDRLGRARALFLYLAGGVAAALMHILTNASSPIPTIGASGAVAAVMGAYFLLYPRANVLVAVPPFIFGPYFVVPALIYLGFWFLLQFLSGTFSLVSTPASAGGIAWWAHIGGFVFGALLCSVIKVKRFYRRDEWAEMSPW